MKPATMKDVLQAREWRVRRVNDDPAGTNPLRKKRFDAHYKDLLEPAAHISAWGICEMLAEKMLESSDYDFKWHLETLSTFADNAVSQFLNLTQNPKLSFQHRMDVFQKFLKVLGDALQQLAKYEKKEMKKFPHSKRREIKAGMEISLLEIFTWQMSEWPTLFPRSNKTRKARCKFILEQLELAKWFPFNIESPRAGRTRYWGSARALVDQILEYRQGGWGGEIVDKAKQLPDPSPNTKEEWWKFAKIILVVRYGEKFWEHDQFKDMIDKPDGRGGCYSIEKPGTLRTDILRNVKKCFFSYYKPFSGKVGLIRTS
jgi:hypothetical protein